MIETEPAIAAPAARRSLEASLLVSVALKPPVGAACTMLTVPLTCKFWPTVAEETLLQLLLANKELRKIVLPRLETADYENLASCRIFRALVSLDKEDQEIGFDSLSAATADDSQAGELLARLMMTETTESFDESLTAADSCLDALRVTKLDRDIDELGSELAEAERAADGEKLNRLAMEQLELKKRRGALLARSQTPESPAR